MEVVDLNKTVLLPLQQEGKLSLYGFAVSQMSTRSPDGFGPIDRYNGSIFIPYLKNTNSEYAYLPFDINRMNFFNLGSLRGKFKKAIEEVGKDCPEFMKYMEDYYDTINNMDKKEMKKQYYEKEEKKKDIRKTVKNKEMQNFLQVKIDVEYLILPYIEMVNKYNNTCAN